MKEAVSFYNNQKIKFPMIASVIEGNQAGQIFQNPSGTHFFVINKFGFCQEFYSEFDDDFFKNTLISLIKHPPQKLRLYAPLGKMEKFLIDYPKASQAKRIQFKYNGKLLNLPPSDKVSVIPVTIEDIKNEDFGLDLNKRYWKDEKDFAEHSMAVVALCNGSYAGICYSAGNGDSRAEIDVFVKEEYRGLGIGKRLVNAFSVRCRENKVVPNWDCYANNQASVNLAKSCGFLEDLHYEFYNILQSF